MKTLISYFLFHNSSIHIKKKNQYSYNHKYNNFLFIVAYYLKREKNDLYNIFFFSAHVIKAALPEKNDINHHYRSLTAIIRSDPTESSPTLFILNIH